MSFLSQTLLVGDGNILHWRGTKALLTLLSLAASAFGYQGPLGAHDDLLLAFGELAQTWTFRGNQRPGCQ